LLPAPAFKVVEPRAASPEEGNVKAHPTPRWTKTVAWALCMAVAASAAPSAAAEPPAAAKPPAKGKLAASALAVAAAKEARALQAPPEAPPSSTEEPRSFLGSTRGRIALVLLAAGVGWTIYSHSHDRIKSPIR
jgi:hypothetical protein